MERQYAVYIMTNKNNAVLYTGVTNELIKRTYQHKNELVDGFTKRYNCTKLVYYEFFDNILDAIQREKQIKGGSRAKKIARIKSMNPTFDGGHLKIPDLAEIVQIRLRRPSRHSQDTAYIAHICGGRLARI